MRTLSKVFLARWIVLQTFIDVVSDDNQGKLPSSIRHDWLLFQLHPADIPIIKGPSTLHDPFTHIFWQLSGASQETLSTLVGLYSSQVLAIIKAKPFFCVVDEAQVAGEVYMGAFSSSDGKTPRPVLRPLVGYFKMHQSIRLIVSGTGFSLSLHGGYGLKRQQSDHPAICRSLYWQFFRRGSPIILRRSLLTSYLS